MKVNENKLRVVFILAIVISFVANYAEIFDRKLDPNGDNYYYFLLAHSLSVGNGYVSNIGPTPEPHTHFPPGYPAFMAPFMRLFPNGNVVVTLKLLNGLLFLVSLLLLFRIIRKGAGRHGIWYAFVTCMLCTFHAQLLRWSTILMSEMLYTAISLGIIAICQDLDWEKLRKKDVWQIVRLVGLCLLVAAAYLVRTMALSVIMAVALAFIVLAVKEFRRRKENGRRWLLPLLACGLVVASLFIAMGSWNLRNRHVVPNWKSDYLVSFQLPTDADDNSGPVAFWTSRIGKNLGVFIPYYIPFSVLNPEKARFPLQAVDRDDFSWIAGVLVIALVVIGFLAMKELSWLLLLYTLITFGVLVIYPTQFADTRYFIPLLPLLIGGFVVGIGTVVGWIVRKLTRRERNWVSPVAAVALIAILVPIYMTSLKYFQKLASFKTYAEIPGMEPLQEYIDACVKAREFPPELLTAALKPEIFHVYSNYRHAIPIPRTGTPEEVLSYLEYNRVDMFIVDNWFPSAYRTMIPLMKAYPERFVGLGIYGKPEKPTFLVGFLPPKEWMDNMNEQKKQEGQE